MKILGSYKNGNYDVFICDDGTKIRANDLDNLTPAFPESIDMKICNRCDMGCPMCHEQSVPGGELADLKNPILDSLHPYTELAIGGGNPLEHYGIVAFLYKMKAKKVICNMTVHLRHFLDNKDLLAKMCDAGLIHGLGISVSRPLTRDEISAIKEFPNAVIHVIAGLVDGSIMTPLENKGLKILVLGYKDFGRGHDLIQSPEMDCRVKSLIVDFQEWLKRAGGKFKTISFDNLAIKQLDVRSIVGEDVWQKNYMGDDGGYTMYIDLVKNEYAVSSTSPRHKIDSDNIDELFARVRKESGHDC